MKAHGSQIVLNHTIRFINNQKSAGINLFQLAQIYWLGDWIISYNHEYDFVSFSFVSFSAVEAKCTNRCTHKNKNHRFNNFLFLFHICNIFITGKVTARDTIRLLQ